MFKLLALASLLSAAAAAPGDYPQIIGLVQTGSTLNSVTLSWTLDASEFVPIKYTLVVDGILTIQFFYDGSDTYTVTGLNSCHQYTFVLTADYDEGSGEPVNGIGSTVYETPGGVGDLSVVGSVISWTAPVNSRCVDFYQVCYESSVTGANVCTQVVTGTSYDLGELSACDTLDVTVYAVGGAYSGPPSTVQVVTETGVPGKPRDVEVVPLTESTVLLAWNPPLENPACVQDYAIVYGPVSNFTATEASHGNKVSKTDDDEEDEDDENAGMAEGPSGQTETAELNNLTPCTDFRFGVAAVSIDGEYSEEVVVFLSTNGSAPGLLPDVVFDQDENSITISWGDVSGETCLGVIQICYVDPATQEWECVEVPSTPNTWTLSGLGACQEYAFRITGVSPDGEPGEPIVVTVPTKDRAPGAVQNLTLSNVDVTSVTLTYDAPLNYSECADQYVVRYTNILDVVDTKSADTRAGSFTTVIDGLDACAVYVIDVNAVSPTGIEGPITQIGAQLKQATPEPPAGGSLVGRTETSLTVLWFAPIDTRFCLDSYEVRVTEDNSGPTQLVPVLNFNQEILETFSSLNSCTSYNVLISSKNSETGTQSPFASVISSESTLC